MKHIYLLISLDVHIPIILFIKRYWLFQIVFYYQSFAVFCITWQNMDLKVDSRAGMTRQFLIVLELFSVLKSKLSNFRFRLIFIFNKKYPQSCQFVTYWQKALFEFLRSQTGKMTFITFNVIISSYVLLYLNSQKLYIILKKLLDHFTEIIFLS